MADQVDPDIVIVTGGGGCPYVTSTSQPHLGGNFDGGDVGTSYPKTLWPWLRDTFHVESMVDVGCGTGEAVRWFSANGVHAYGVDGLQWNIDRCVERGGSAILHDLTTGPCLFAPVDLIWCSDVGEHIEERFIGNLLVTLRQCKVLAFCHGTEESADQGWHHVNNKPEAYWVKMLAAVGMVESPEHTAKSRELGNHGWWPISGRIYRPA